MTQMSEQTCHPGRPAAPATLVCVTCRYHLAGLATDGACPECGSPVAESQRVIDDFFGVNVVGAARETGAGVIIARGLRVGAFATAAAGLGTSSSILINGAPLLLAGFGAIVLTASAAAVVSGVLRMKRHGRRVAKVAIALFLLALAAFLSGLIVAVSHLIDREWSGVFFLGAVTLHLASLSCAFASVHWLIAGLAPELARATKRLMLASIVGAIAFLLLLVALAILFVVAMGGSLPTLAFVAVQAGMLIDTVVVTLVFAQTAARLKRAIAQTKAPSG